MSHYEESLLQDERIKISWFHPKFSEQKNNTLRPTLKLKHFYFTVDFLIFLGVV
jgi:hypothetical protein